MVSAQIQKVENGYILQITKLDRLEGRQAQEVFIFEKLDDALEKIKKG